jgi:hypothetical protein
MTAPKPKKAAGKVVTRQRPKRESMVRSGRPKTAYYYRDRYY